MVGTVVYFFLTFFFWGGVLYPRLPKAMPRALRICLVFFVSNMVSVWIIFLLANIYIFFTNQVLLKATVTYLLSIIIVFILRKDIFIHYFEKLNNYLTNQPRDLLIIRSLSFVSIFALSYFFFTAHLQQSGGRIYISNIYWDFHWHIRLIQSFSLGDNFFPQNESVAGVISVYHYFWALIPAIFQALGASIAQAINTYSVIFFSTLLITATEIVYAISKSKLSFLITPLILISHGSLKMFDPLHRPSLSQVTQYRPDLTDFNDDRSFGYNGNMFNMFYFLQERQLIIACLGLLNFGTILWFKNEFRTKYFILLAVLFGLFTQWHLYVALTFVILGGSYWLIETIRTKRLAFSKLFWFVAIVTTLTGIHLIVLQTYTRLSPYFDSSITQGYPKINFEFAQWESGSLHPILQTILYYFYAYGFRLIVYGIGLYVLFKKKRQLFFLTVSMSPIFLLINTIQLSPHTVYDNHKWLKPFNLFLDTFTLAGFLIFWKQFPSKVKQLWLWIIIVLAMTSGLVSAYSYLSQKPNVPFGNLESDRVKAILQTPPQSVFITLHTNDIFLAGRRTFVASYLGQSLGIRTNERFALQDKLFELQEIKEKCDFIRGNNLLQLGDYLYEDMNKPLIDINLLCRET